MRSPLILIHDIGTNGDKCVLCDKQGVIVASSYDEYGVEYPRAGWAEQEPDVWWNAIRRTTKTVLRKARKTGKDLAVISFSGQMAGTVPVDRHGKPLRPCMVWLDSRSDCEAQFINKKLGKRRIYKITGGVLTGKDVFAKILWLKQHEVDVYRRTYKFLDVKDYVESRLTGNYTTDYTCASYTTLF